jgi:hypothetical protein
MKAMAFGLGFALVVSCFRQLPPVGQPGYAVLGLLGLVLLVVGYRAGRSRRPAAAVAIATATASAAAEAASSATVQQVFVMPGAGAGDGHRWAGLAEAPWMIPAGVHLQEHTEALESRAGEDLQLEDDGAPTATRDA